MCMLINPPCKIFLLTVDHTLSDVQQAVGFGTVSMCYRYSMEVHQITVKCIMFKYGYIKSNDIEINFKWNVYCESL